MTASSPRPRPTAEPGLATVIALPGRGHDAHTAAVHREDGRRRRERRRESATGTDRPGPSRPDPVRLAALLVRLTAEVAAGRRPLRQLEPLLAPTLARRLAAGLRPGVPRPQEQPSVLRVVAGDPTPTGAVEATVLVGRAGRVSAVAVRLERHLGGWRATELTAPEAGYAALPTPADGGTGRRRDAFDDAAADAEASAAIDTAAEAGRLTRRRGSA